MKENSALRNEVTAFFDEFVEAFRTFDGTEIARRYLSPYSALHADGSIDCFASNADTAKYFQKIVDGYHHEGCRSCRYNDLEVISVGGQCALGSVTWELCRENGSVLSSWRESYNLARVRDGLRIFASVDHVA
ncbi:hypothetical protein [Rhodoferax sp. UBA5149]|uniref:hypothetical protein n=1 Tax=Rhodoferax sp. UBA5149 TaxID=1947379 RepID=UPI0025DBCC5D|nr:hypothetical protein [Rhodoferax sp. UBA5149]